MSKVFEIGLTKEAFEKSEGQMNSITKMVHKELLETDFLKKNGNRIWGYVDDIASLHPEALKPAFIGMLSDRMVSISVKGFTEYDRNYVAIVRAALVVNILLDSGVYSIRTEGKTVTLATGRRVTIPQYFIELGGKITKKDLLIGLEEQPGVVNQKYVKHLRLNGKAKLFLKRMASMPFKVSAVANRDLIMKGYKLMTDYWSDSKEAGVTKRGRYSDIADMIVELQGKDEFFLSTKFDHRLRVYYYLQLVGMRPQGKLWETQMIDMAEPEYIDEAGANHIRHIIYVLRHGRASLSEALGKLSKADLEWARDQDPMGDDLKFDGTRNPLDEFGERIVANKAFDALTLHENGFPCYYMFGKDLTNSGLLMASAAFKSPEMMSSANLGGHMTVHDSHTAFGEVYDLPLERRYIKDIHMSLLHGSTDGTIKDDIHKVLGDKCGVTKAIVHANNLKVYGKCVDNIDAIAGWGSAVIDNYQTTLQWKMPDGLMAMHESVLKHVPIEIYAAGTYAATHNDKGFSKDMVVKTMPMSLDANGYSVYASGYGKGVYSKKGVIVKNRGLYANITHSYDAFLVRRVADTLMDQGKTFLLKHDDYMVPPASFDMVVVTCQDFFSEMFDNNYYQDALDQIAEHSDGRAKYVPQLVMGDAENTVSLSFNFLMP